MLQIPVHRNDVFAGSVIEPCGKSRRLSEVPSQLYHRDTAIDRSNLAEEMEGKIRASVIDKHHPEPVRHAVQEMNVSRYVEALRFVVARDNKRTAAGEVYSRSGQLLKA